MKKFKLILLPILFLGGIYFLFFNQIFGWFDSKSNDENRKFADLPALYFKHLDPYPHQFDTYLQDNFRFRVPFLNMYHKLFFHLQISPNPEQVLIGKSGQLFMAGKDLASFQEKDDFTSRRLDTLEQNLRIKKEYLDARKIPFYWLICPYKLHIYTEDLPDGIRERGKNRSQQIKTHLSVSFPGQIIYPLSVLRQQRKNAYFKYDNHWTEKGSYYAYLELMKAIKANVPELNYLPPSEIKWKMEIADKSGLLNFIGKTGELTEKVPVAILSNDFSEKAKKFGFRPPEDFPYPWEYEYHFINPKPLNSKKILVITDSFGEALHPFIRASFGESLFIFNNWEYSVSKEIVEEYRPDIVVFVTMEALIDNWNHSPALVK